MRKGSIVFFIFLSISNYNLLGKIEYFAPQNILKFAHSLYESNNFEYAIGEYKRYLYLFQKLPENTDLIYFRIGTSFLHLKKYNKSLFYYDTIISDFPLSIYRGKSFYNIAYSYLLQNKFNESILYIENNRTKILNKDIKSRISMLKIVNYIYNKEFNIAEKNINKLTDLDQNEDFTILKKIITSSKKIDKKNKIAAGVLSTIIPGSGKIYCSRTIDGLISFAVIGALAYQAYDGFKNDGKKSTKGWIAASFGGAFYLGNIYGSIAAVNVYNFKQEKKFFENVDKKIKNRFTPY